VAYFSKPENMVLKLHIHHASHHVFTTEKPHPNTQFSRNPHQKPQQTQTFSPIHHARKKIYSITKKIRQLF
jgi:hypothetical protein